MTTKSDLASARAYLARMAAASAFSRETTEAIELVLCALAPTGDELDAEARAAYPANTPESRFCRGAYKRGARREGLR